MVLWRELLPLGEAITAPHFGMQIRFQQHGIEFGALCFHHAAHSQHPHIGDGVQFVCFEMFYKYKILFLAVMQLAINGDIDFAVKHKE